MLVFSF